MSCVFCSIPEAKWLLHNEHFYVVWDTHPLAEGHALVIARQHVEDFFDIPPELLPSLHEMVASARDLISARCHPVGYNLLMNCGTAAGQTIFHYHMHIIPRYGRNRRSPVRGFFRRNHIG